MTIQAVSSTIVQTQTSAANSGASSGTSFAGAMDGVSQSQAPNLRIFKGAPDFIVELAQKYNVHISKTAVPEGQNGPYTPAQNGEPALPTVHIHPKALERMENDPEFFEKVEREIARLSAAMHRVQEEGVSGVTPAGTSITVHEDGTVTSAVFVDEDDNSDTWAITEMLMKRVDALCEAMHAENQEKMNNRLEEIMKSRAASEYRRIGADVTAQIATPSIWLFRHNQLPDG